ncbi:PaaI family thioesterase [Thermus sp.]|uniref:PaaI family thioesterase n=1 Tax=Thermus sp. TaxID=275 RepID=UPI00307DC208
MDLKALAQTVLERQPFNRLLGMELLEAQPGSVAFRLPLKEAFYQHLGAVHGGVVATLLDNALTYAAGSLLGPGVLTVEFKVNFLKPGKGEALLARGYAVSQGKRLAVARSEVYALEGGAETLVALGQGTILRISG